MELSNFVIAGGRPTDVPTTTPAGFKMLMEQCWIGDSELRPTFVEIVKRMSTSVDAVHDDIGVVRRTRVHRPRSSAVDMTVV